MPQLKVQTASVEAARSSSVVTSVDESAPRNNNNEKYKKVSSVFIV